MNLIKGLYISTATLVNFSGQSGSDNMEQIEPTFTGLSFQSPKSPDLTSGAAVPNPDQDEEGDSDPEIRKLEGDH